MKKLFYLLLLSFIFERLSAQDNNDLNSLSIQSYIDFTKSDVLLASWLTYDNNKFSLEARYNYDWDNNLSVYGGLLKRVKNWKIRFFQGVTFGSTTGISISPTVILDKRKIFIFNQTQYVIGISKMPSYFLHWGEFYYKPIDAIWIGLTDRIYLEKSYADIAFGPQILFAHKNFFLTFYWWIPVKLTESKAFVVAGYEQYFQRKNK